jgi:hypothetical protein
MGFYGLLNSVATRTWTSMAPRVGAWSPFSAMNMNAMFIRGKHTLKTNKSVAKRFRVRGNGSLKRYVTLRYVVECTIPVDAALCMQLG